MISSGLFILPSLAFANTGPSVIIAYLLASILILPSVFSNVELTTAMPRAGGTYFYIERSFGSILGFFSGLATWFALALKSAFAIVGMTAFIQIILSGQAGIELTTIQLRIIAIICCLFFTMLNIVSVRHTSRFQVVLVAALYASLALFIIAGLPSVKVMRFDNFMPHGPAAFAATAGLVFISFGGVTKVTTIAEEVRNPEKNMMYGILLAWFCVSLCYFLTVFVTVGVLDPGPLADTLVPISMAAKAFLGTPGYIIMGLAAAAAFITTANGGILAASRCPLAMSRDNLLPGFLRRVNSRFETPHISILTTSLFMIAALAFLDLEDLVKTASTLLILLYMLANASVIIMRESRLQSYRPKFYSPLYPYLHIISIFVYFLLIIDMGLVPLSVSIGFILLSLVWYFAFISRRVRRQSAVMHVVQRVTDRTLAAADLLENELRDILFERDKVTRDRFDHLVQNAEILDFDQSADSASVFEKVASVLAPRLNANPITLYNRFIEREKQSTTIIQPGLAIPHVVIEGESRFDLLIVRSKPGIKFPSADHPVHVMFVLVGTRDQRNYHLRALMAVAQIAQDKQFENNCLTARSTEAMRNLILLSERKRHNN